MNLFTWICCWLTWCLRFVNSLKQWGHLSFFSSFISFEHEIYMRFKESQCCELVFNLSKLCTNSQLQVSFSNKFVLFLKGGNILRFCSDVIKELREFIGHSSLNLKSVHLTPSLSIFRCARFPCCASGKAHSQAGLASFLWTVCMDYGPLLFRWNIGSSLEAVTMSRKDDKVAYPYFCFRWTVSASILYPERFSAGHLPVPCAYPTGVSPHQLGSQLCSTKHCNAIHASDKKCCNIKITR